MASAGSEEQGAGGFGSDLEDEEVFVGPQLASGGEDEDEEDTEYEDEDEDDVLEDSDGEIRVDEDTEEDEGSEENNDRGSLQGRLGIPSWLAARLLGFATTQRRDDPLRRMPKLVDVQPVALRGDLAQQLNAATAAAHKRSRAPWEFLGVGADASTHSRRDAELGRAVRQRLQAGKAGAQHSASPNNANHKTASKSSSPPSTNGGVRTRAQAQRESTAAHESTGPAAADSAGTSDEGLPDPSVSLADYPVVNSAKLLLRRELVLGSARGLSPSQQRHILSHTYLPRYPAAVVDALPTRAYIGQFSTDGRFFVAAFQDKRVRLYDVERGWRLRKDVTTRMSRWTITDTCVSPDNRFLLYSSILPVIHLVEVGSSYDSVVDSVANVTQVHEALHFDSSPAGHEARLRSSFGIWSVRWSGDGREIIAGTNDQSVYIYDVERQQVLSRVEGHKDDVNAVAYADESPNIIVTGSDDTYIKVWDRRTLRANEAPQDSTSSAATSGSSSPGSRGVKPVGVLVGHTEGLTHLCPRGDGRYMLSNCKDQTAKLWDLRNMKSGGSVRSPVDAARLSTRDVPCFNWDYRWQPYPAAGRDVRHPHDSSVMTYRGHYVLHTLIRAYFSPAHTTGQRLIYTGGADGHIHVFDVVTGQEVEGSPFRQHSKLVRDCSWHPYEPIMASVSWDGCVVRWEAGQRPEGPDHKLPTPGVDALDDLY